MRTVCAYSLSFPGTSAIDVWREVESWVVNWYRGAMSDVQLPSRWLEGWNVVFHPVLDHELSCKVTDGEGGPLREFRWRFPDFADRSLVWSVEAAALANVETAFTLVLRIASADFELVPARFQLRTPRVIRALVGRGGAHIGVHRVGLTPTLVQPDQVPHMALSLLEQSRRHPMVVISPDAHGDEYAVDPNNIANRLAGLASVFVLSSRWAGYALTDELGKQYSCYNGAVRVYWPRFERNCDPYAHPLWLPPLIEERGGPDAFADQLQRTIAAVASFRFVEPDSMRAFRARLDEARVARLRAAPEAGYEGLFDEYVKLDAHARDLRVQLDKANEEIAELRSAIALQPTFDPAQGSEADRGIETVFDAVEEGQRRSTNVVYLTDAFESARISPFRQPARVLSALLAIEDVASRWVEQLEGGASMGARRDAFRERGFDYKEDISPTAEGKWGEDYTYRYNGRRIVFAPHITIGAKGPDRCLSIHLHWDDATRKVVIAHVGRHKKNTLT